MDNPVYNNVKQDEPINVAPPAVATGGVMISPQGNPISGSPTVTPNKFSQLGTNQITVGVGNSIQYAIDAMHRAGGGKVFLSAGTHLSSESLVLYSDIILEGEGIGITIIDFGGADINLQITGTLRTSAGTITVTEGSVTVSGSLSSFTNSSVGDLLHVTADSYNFVAEIKSIESATSLTLVDAWPLPTITATSAYRLMGAIKNNVLKNITIQNSSSINGNIQIEYANNFICDNVKSYKNTTGDGIHIQWILNSELRNIESSYNGSTSGADGFSIITLLRTTLYNCSAFGNGGMGFNFNAQDEEVSVFACLADGNGGNGFGFSGNGFTIMGCSAAGNDDNGFDFNGAVRSVLISCFAFDNGSDGLEISSGSAENLVIGCSLINNDAYGIQVVVNSNRNDISDCYFSGNASGVINDGAAHTFYKNRGSVAFTAANGANNNIDIGENKIVRVTGPTAAFSISGISAGVNGKEVYIYNAVAFDMTITNEGASSTAANRILRLLEQM